MTTPTTTVIAPSAPINFQGTVSGTSVALTWGAPVQGNFLTYQPQFRPTPPTTPTPTHPTTPTPTIPTPTVPTPTIPTPTIPTPTRPTPTIPTPTTPTVTPLWDAQIGTNTAWMTHGSHQGSDPFAYGFKGGGGGGFSESNGFWSDPPLDGTAQTCQMSGSDLRLGCIANTGGFTNSSGGSAVCVSTIIVNFDFTGGAFYQYGYHEFALRLSNNRGFMFHFDIEDYNPWQEIDLDIWIDSSGTHHIVAKDASAGVTFANITNLDVTQTHAYGLDWQSNWLRFYVDGVLHGSTNNNYNRPFGSYMLVDTASYDPAGDGEIQSLPAYAYLSYYRIYTTKPASPTTPTPTVPTPTTTTTHTTWNPNDKSSIVTLSNNNLTATSGGGTATNSNPESVRSTSSRSSGKYIFEVTMVVGGFNGTWSDWQCGLCTANFNFAATLGLGGDVESVGYSPITPTNAIFINNVELSSGNMQESDGAIITCCVDLTNRLIWFSSPRMRSAGLPWNSNSGANPASGTGGVSLSTMTSGAAYIVFQTMEGGQVATINAAGAFSQAIPSGFAAWDTSSPTPTIPTPTVPNPLRIMPMGDSITQGTVPGGYRASLYPLLVNNDGYNVLYVGSTNTNSGGGLPSNETNHEGFSGWVCPQLIDLVVNQSIIQTYTPNIVLLLIGTNDLFGSPQTDVAGLATNIRSLLDDMIARRSSIKILLSTLLQRPDDTTGLINNINALIPGIAAARSANVSVVDLSSRLTFSDLADGLHPNQTGYNKMAAGWEIGIKALFSGTPTSPTTPTMESPAGTTVPPAANINASPIPGSPGSGNLIAITPAQTISINGTVIGGASVVELYYDNNHTAAQKNAAGNWYAPITSSGTGTQIPDPTPTSPTPTAPTPTRPTPTAPTPTGVVAVSANTFLNSMGINTHISQGYSSANYVSMLVYTGIRNIRDSAAPLANFQILPAGTKVCLCVWNDAVGGPALAATLAGIGMLLAIEGPNEPNNFPIEYNGVLGGGTNSWIPVAQCQRDIYANVRAIPAIANYPVFAPSETGAETDNVGLQFAVIPTGAGASMPDGTVYATHINEHNYVIGNSHTYVDNQAWQCADPQLNDTWDGCYGNNHLTWLKHYTGYTVTQLLTVPKVTTETGWDSVSNPGGERVQGIVLINNMLAQFKRGWSYTFIYELVDGEGSVGNQGIYTSSYTAKLAATYFHNLTTILADSATSASPGSLNYSIPSQASVVHDLLLQKSNGTFELVVWGESVSGSFPTTVNLGAIYATVKIYDVTSGTTPTQVLTNVSSVPLTLTDHAMIIEVSPAPTTPTTPPPPSNFITPGVGSFTDANNNVYTLTAGGVATENGVAMAAGGGTSAMAYYNGLVYGQDAANLQWYTWNQSGWTGPVAAPLRSGQRIIPSAHLGVIHAATVPQPPQQARNAGFSNLVFNDDFTSSSTIAPTVNSTAAGYNWYWGSTGGQPTVNPSFVPGASDGRPTAANGASTGIMVINMAGNNYGAQCQTVPQQNLASYVNAWQHGYIEAYIQFDVNGDVTPHGAFGWPAFWSYDTRALQNPAIGSIITECDFMEQFWQGNYASTMHNWQVTSAGTSGSNLWSTDGHPISANSDAALQPKDSGWHKYGCLWTGNGTTGTVQFYFDDQIMVGQNGQSSFPVGPSTNSPSSGMTSMESAHLYLVLGSGVGWIMNVDWVRVWQMSSPTSPTTPTPTTPTTVEVPLGVHLGTYLGGGQGTEGSIATHWADVKTGFGRVPAILCAVIINSYQNGYALPNQWGGDVYAWTSANGIPVDGSVSPFLDGRFTDGTSTDVDFAGVVAGTYDAPLQAALNLWKSAGNFKKIYIRMNWEFNTNFLGWGVPNSGQVTSWIAAWKHWCNVCHTWGNNNGIVIRMVWSPDTSYSLAESTTFNLPVVNFFPIPDSGAVNGRYIDVIGSDIYMKGYNVSSNFGQTTSPLSSTTVWSLGTFVAMAQTYNCNIGISEVGDGTGFDNNNSWQDGIMNNFATYLNTLKTLNPPVAIEFINLFDVTTGGANQCTAGNFPNMAAGWRSMMGTGGNGSIPTVTTTISAPTTPTPTTIESADGTTITTVGPTINASPTPGTPGSGNILAITSGGQISLNNSVPSAYSATANVVELYYINHTAYQKNAAGNWFGPITATSSGVGVNDPTPIPTVPTPTIPTPTVPTPTIPTPTTPTPSSYRFDDEFASLSIWNGITGNWSYAPPSSPNGYIASDMTSWFVNPTFSGTAATDANPYSIAAGILSIAVKTLPGDVVASNVGGAKYLSGYLQTAANFAPTYGYFELRAKMSAAPGTMSAFWLYRLGGSGVTEIDIVETLANQPTMLTNTVHTNDQTAQMQTLTTVADMTTNFHVYGCDWQANTITWYFDGVQTAQIATPSDMHQPMFMLLDTAAGTSSSWEGQPTGAGLPAAMQIDYVRVWQTQQTPESPNGTTIVTAGPIINASPVPGSPGMGNQIAITSSAQISVNGYILAPTNGVVKLYYTNHTAYQYNGNTWFGPITNTSGGTAVSNPIPTPTVPTPTIPTPTIPTPTVPTPTVPTPTVPTPTVPTPTVPTPTVPTPTIPTPTIPTPTVPTPTVPTPTVPTPTVPTPTVPTPTVPTPTVPTPTVPTPTVPTPTVPTPTVPTPTVPTPTVPTPTVPTPTIPTPTVPTPTVPTPTIPTPTVPTPTVPTPTVPTPTVPTPTGGWINYGSPVSNLSVVVSGLNPNTSYDFDLVAINTAGIAASAIITKITSGTVPTTPTPTPTIPTPTTIAPGAVQNLQAAVDGNTVTLSWLPPVVGNDVVYQSQYRLSAVIINPTPTRPTVPTPTVPTPTIPTPTIPTPTIPTPTVPTPTIPTPTIPTPTIPTPTIPTPTIPTPTVPTPTIPTIPTPPPTVPTVPTPMVESPNGTTITTVGPAITDKNGFQWTLTSAAQVAVNGVVDMMTASVIELVYYNSLIYQETSNFTWWVKATPSDTWLASLAPITTPTVPTTGIRMPPQAVAVGYTNLVFSDDFTTNTTIAPTASASGGYKWYWNFSNTAVNWIVATSATAASINNGNAGGGSNASSSGGILQINTGNTVLVTIPGNTLNTGHDIAPALGVGNWQHFYVEAYIQTRINGNLSSDPSNGWPSFWSWTLQSLQSFGWSQSSLNSPNATEVDFFETYGSIYGNTPGIWGGTVHNWATNMTANINTSLMDSNWHTFGMLWVPGTISVYFDNVLMGSVSTTSICPVIETQSLFLNFGTGINWQVNVDWVRVWQGSPPHLNTLTNIHTTTITPTSITLVWDVLAGTNISYVAAIGPFATGNFTEKTTPTNSVTFTGLLAAHQYSMYVYATDGTLYSSSSGLVNASTTTAVPTIVPTTVPTPSPTFAQQQLITSDDSTRMVVDRFSLTDKSSLISLSIDNLTATSGGTTLAGSQRQFVRSTTEKTHGKIYFEATIVSMTPDIAVGIGNINYNYPANGLGGDYNSIGFYPSFGATADRTQAIYIGNAMVSSIAFSPTSVSVEGEVIRFAIDFGQGLMWVSTYAMVAQGNAWNNSPHADPVSDIDGISFSNLVGPFYVIFNESEGGGAVTINFGLLPFTSPIPLGFTAWNGRSSATTITSRCRRRPPRHMLPTIITTAARSYYVAPLWDAQIGTNTAWMSHGSHQGSDPWAFGFKNGDGGGLTESQGYWSDPPWDGTGQTCQMSGSDLRLGCIANPGGFTNANGGSAVCVSTIIVNFDFTGGGFYQYGYHEFAVRLTNNRGFLFHFDIEDYDPWNEIDIDIWIDSSGTHHVMANDVTGGAVFADLTSVDVTQTHAYGLDWQSGWVRFYVDGVLHGSTSNRYNRPFGTYMLVDTATYNVNDGQIQSLPAYAYLTYYRIYTTRPAPTVPTPTIPTPTRPTPTIPTPTRPTPTIPTPTIPTPTVPTPTVPTPTIPTPTRPTPTVPTPTIPTPTRPTPTVPTPTIPTPTTTVPTPTVPTPAGAWINFGVPISDTSIAIPGLAVFTQFDFEVIAINSAGSAVSAIITVVTGGPPTIPTPTRPTTPTPTPRIPTPPPTPTTIITPQTADQFFQVITAGVYDSAFLSVFQSFVTGGYTSFYIRPGYEMNRSTQIWNIGASAATAADFVLAFQRISDLAHNFAGATIKVIWNPMVGTGAKPLPYMNFYPGDDYVDVIGIDTYGGLAGQDPTSSISDVTNYTVLAACALAKARGKTIALPETGINTAAPAPTWTVNFINALASVIKGAGVEIEFVSIWDYDGNGSISWSLPSDNQAEISAAYKTGFGIIPVNAPGPISDVVAITITTSSLSFGWSQPVTGNLPFTYQPQYKVAGTSQWINLSTTLTTSATANGLKANTSYNVQIITSNIVGSSVSAAATLKTAAILPLGGSVSGSQNTGSFQPVITAPMSGTVSTGSLLALAGIHVSDNVAGIFSCNIDCISGTIILMNGGVAVIGTGTHTATLNSTIGELNAALSSLEYSPTGSGDDAVIINVIDPAGQENTLSIAITITGLATLPGPINISQITTTSSTSLTIVWTSPSSGTSPFSYQVQFRVTGSLGWATSQNSIITDTWYVLTGLMPSTTYDIQIIVFNSVGSTLSSIVNGITNGSALAAPSIVQNLLVGQVTDNSIALSWTPPAQGDSLVYSALYRLNGNTPTHPTTPTIPTPTIPTVPTIPTIPTPTRPTPTIPTIPTPTRPTPTIPTPTRPTPTVPTTPTPTTGTVSPDGTTITTVGPAITDANGILWTLTSGAQVAVNGIADTTTANVIELVYYNGLVYQENASLGWWSKATPSGTWLSTSAPITTPTAPTAPTTPTPTTPTTGNFSVSGGKIIHPNGSVFWGRGVNVNDWAASAAISNTSNGYPLLQTFPNLSIVRLNMNDYSDIATYGFFISCLTSRGIVVLIDDHVNFPTPAFTGARLTQAGNWFAGVAQTYINEPFVWFGAQNEPAGGDGGPLMQGYYNPIRATGNNNIILSGYNMNSITKSYFSNMHNVGFDAHFYAWLEDNFGTNATGALNDELNGLATTSADGQMPYVIGEYGDSTDGSNIDADWQNVVNAVHQSGWGTIAWAWAPGGPGDVIIQGNSDAGNPTGALTSYGQVVANYIAAGTPPTRGTPTPTRPTPTTVPTPTRPTPTTVPTPTRPTPTTVPTAAKRNWYDNPGQDGSMWVQPFYSSAQWDTSSAAHNQLFSQGGSTNVWPNYATPFYIGRATDPTVTVTDGSHSITVHLPAGAQIEQPTSQYDQSIGGLDISKPYLWWNISGAVMDGSPQGTARQGSVISGTYGFVVGDGTGLILEDGVVGTYSQNAMGNIQEPELLQAVSSSSYIIQHMLCCQIPASFFNSNHIWPLSANDVNGSGMIPEGTIIGIPPNISRPAGKSRGFNLLFDNLQQYGWIVYNISGAPGINIGVVPFSSATQSLASDITNSISSVLAYGAILTNQTGPGSIKGYTSGATSLYPPPPLLDFSPTGGSPVLPSSFGAWFPGNYNVMSTG